VLARYFGVAGSPSDAQATRRLWELAQRCTPGQHVAAYTQAIMDLGATVCVRRKPLCHVCPLARGCVAHRSGRQHELPAPRRAGARRARRTIMVMALDESGSVLLERRPASGVWGGLWSLPEFASVTAARAFIRGSLSAARGRPATLAEVEHAFTHFDLRITPLLVRCRGVAAGVEEEGSLWYNVRAPARIGLPAPVATMLGRLADQSLFDASE